MRHLQIILLQYLPNVNLTLLRLLLWLNLLRLLLWLHQHHWSLLRLNHLNHRLLRNLWYLGLVYLLLRSLLLNRSVSQELHRQTLVEGLRELRAHPAAPAPTQCSAQLPVAAEDLAMVVGRKPKPKPQDSGSMSQVQVITTQKS